jgi:hypothetical protein
MIIVPKVKPNTEKYQHGAPSKKDFFREWIEIKKKL